MKFIYYLLIFFITFFLSCNTEKKPNNEQIKGQSIKLDYAKGFKIDYKNNRKIISVYNPWQNANNIKYSYLLTTTPKKADKKDFYQVIKIPVKRVVCLSTTQVSLLESINEQNSIVGLSNPELVYSSAVNQLIKDKKISDVGFEQALNFEKIIKLKPDLVFVYGIDAESLQYVKKLEELGIKIIIVAEYLEQDPLGKAEWIKYMAAFYNKEKWADSIFKSISNQYLELKELTKKVHTKPGVLTGLPWKGFWYVPGAKSYLTKLIEDAGGSYLWGNNNSTSSFTVNLETVFIKAKKTDVWINCGTCKKISEIISIDDRLGNINTFKNITNNNKRTNKNGGNDYWESGVTNPHIILKDLIKIIHPNLLPDYSPFFYQKLIDDREIRE